MIDEELKYDLSRLPWRGPVIPVSADAPESLQPQRRGMVRAKVFDMDNEEDLAEYSAVLSRVENGYTEVTNQALSTEAGKFRVFLVWTELYMCAPSYQASEGCPVLRGGKQSSPEVENEGYVDERDDEQRLRDSMDSWLKDQERRDTNQRTAPVDDNTPDDDATRGDMNTVRYEEDDVEAKAAADAAEAARTMAENAMRDSVGEIMNGPEGTDAPHAPQPNDQKDDQDV